jgi:hypothetical protein
MSPRRLLAAVAVPLVLGACTGDASPSPSQPAATPRPSESEAQASSAPSSSSAVATASPTATASPQPTPELALDIPDTRDERQVSVTITPTIDGDGGEILVSVTSAADTRVDDLVVRWPQDLGEHLFLAPFVPSEERIREGGDPLVQAWTKWVVGPGERGEPEGTISLGYGPLFPSAVLDVRIFVTRLTSEPVAFDLQVLAGNDILTLATDGAPAELRVEIP